MDTGSSDLWIFQPGKTLKLTNTTNVIATETYGAGTVEGPVVFAELKLGPYTVPSQGTRSALPRTRTVWF